MLFVIHALDAKEALPKRQANYPAHKAYLEKDKEYGVRIVMSGPLVADDMDTRIGSHFLIDAPFREHVEKFHKEDPFYTAGVWGETSITMFIMAKGPKLSE
ncbi:MAG: YciI family protein [Alphaproteobacteria bacterium]|nr:YciI family protein [Alphaproteobacteria bacterium]